MAKEPRFKPMSRFDDIMAHLQHYNTSIYNNEDEGYDYLDNGYFCIAVLNSTGEDDLFIDIEDGGFTLSYGDWDAHYDPFPRQYDHMLADISRFLKNQMYLAVVTQGKDWVCSLSVNAARVEKVPLLIQTREFLQSADASIFVKDIRQNGAEIACSFWNEKLNRTIRVKPGEMH